MISLIDNTLLIASQNQGKVVEITDRLQDFDFTIVSASSYQLDEPEETADSFIGNAELKAKYYGDATGLCALADDSGLVVDGLQGAPGIYSARWAGPNKDFSIAMNRIEDELPKDAPKTAHFVCALSIYNPSNGYFITVEGKCFGHLTFPARGEHGFGYDPIFIPDGYNQTFAELSTEIKQNISHRARAFDLLIAKCMA